MNDTANIEDKLQALRVQYAQLLPSKVAELESSLEAMVKTPASEDVLSTFHRQAHSLAGSGGTYGYARLSQCARELEVYLKSCLAPQRSPALQDAQNIQGLLDRVKDSIANPDVTKEIAKVSSPLPALSDNESPLLFILDDDPFTLNFLSNQLTSFGYQVSVFTEPDALFVRLATETPHAFMIDVTHVVGSGGADITDRLHEKTDAQRPIAFISKSDTFASRLAGVRAGGEAYFVIPVNIDVVAEVMGRLTRRIAPQPFHVLIIEDTPSVAELYATALQSAGMLTYSVTEPTKTLAALENFNPELILLDMYMPGVRGDELAKIIRQQPAYVSTPIVFLSAETDMDKQMAAIRIGGDDFLTKPISLPHLISAVTSRVERYRTLRGLMHRDSLTGLLNHTKSKDTLEYELARAQRVHQPLSFAMLDIDLFKRVNDTYGHPVGDRVIKSLARLLQQRLRKTDFVGRYGGEEFAIIMPNTTADIATKVLDGLRLAFSQIQHYAGDKVFFITFSGGVAESANTLEASTLTAAADQALYQAKHAGRNQICTASAASLIETGPG